jgi:hypothetical protein
MPKGKGLYTRKGASGRTMYFRDGKLISEKSYRSSVTRRRTAPKRRPNPRASPRRKMARRKTYRRRKAMPHPSITGLGAGLSVAQYLNQSDVIGKTLQGKLSSALNVLSKNAVALTTSTSGKAVLSSAIIMATAGGVARKWFPNVKLGTDKHYFKI